MALDLYFPFPLRTEKGQTFAGADHFQANCMKLYGRHIKVM